MIRRILELAVSVLASLLLTLALLVAALPGCKAIPNTWPSSAPTHRYMNGLRAMSWILPPDWQSNPSLIDSLSQYDFLELGDVDNTSFQAFADSLRARTPHPLLYASVTFQRIWDYSNNDTPRRPAPSFGAKVYDALYPSHIAHLAPHPPANYAYGDTAIAIWGGAAEYVINWADPAVPAIYSQLLVDRLTHGAYRPDGLWLDWWEYPATGWWIQAGPSYTVDGDRDGITGLADQEEQYVTYGNWLNFTSLLRRAMGENFLIAANGSAPLTVPLAMTGLTAAFYEHFPYGWGGDNVDYVSDAFEFDGRKYYTVDSVRQLPSPPYQRQRQSTPSGGYIFLDQILRPNFPYIAILSLYCDNSVAMSGPFRSNADEWAYFTSGPQPHYWHGDPFNDLKLLGHATGEPILIDNVWRREFDRGVVEFQWNANRRLPLAPTGNMSHPANPGGPFKYRVVIDGELRYHGGGW